ncbi:MAG: redoxin domain-containing protein [Dehalococcoidia bacterium]|nr:redoxin domain-containing protein [Dehalococcoidia bacterium]MYA52636.1 redoxin domain-containing protein [Dehalococcoidia bacterium]
MAEDRLLDDELQVIRDLSAERMPPPVLEAMELAIEEIEAATIGKALDVGAEAPDFELRDVTHGRTVRLREALTEGPVVLSFYRGEW